MIIELLFIVTTTFFTVPLSAGDCSSAVVDFLSIKKSTDAFGAQFDTSQQGGVAGSCLEGGAQVMVKRKHVLAVFIHGTLFPVPSFSAMHEWAEERLKNKPTQPYVNLLRNKSVLRNQPIGQLGLHPVEASWDSRATGAQLIAWMYQEMYQLLPKDEYALVHPYTFGWDGSLSLSKRKNQARLLLEALNNLIKQFKEKYPLDSIDVVVLAHSHGGNVALHMADWAYDYSNVKIDHLLMFGTPIHGDTQHLPVSSLFGNVYNFHSQGDFIQIADIVSTKKYVPARVFSQEMVIKSPSVKQILVEVGDYSPNHSEFWFFRKPEVFFYRSSFPVSPLPIVAFAPLILHELKKTKPIEHFLKLSLNQSRKQLSLSIIPFLDYWQDSLLQLHKYESSFDYSSLLRQLPLIKNE